MMRRKFLMSAESILPSGFRQVEYLESTGIQYIDTGVLSKRGLRAKYKVSFTRNDEIQQLCAELSGQNNNRIYFPYASGQVFNFCYGITVVTIPNISIVKNRIYEIDAICDIGSASVSINGTVLYTATSTVSSVPGRSFFLFASNNSSGSNYRPAYAKIYSFEMIDTETDTKLAEFIPCIRIFDNKPGMYDLITNSFLTNIGTGEFITP